MQTIYNKFNPHPKGRFTLTFNNKGPQVAVYEVTGINNEVYVESSTLKAGKWMKREYFDSFYDQAINNFDGESSKPVSKGWKRISKGFLEKENE